MIAPQFEPPGNYKDPEKIAANLAEQKAKWKDRAALSPLTGKVLCIGIRDIDGSFCVIDGDGDEAELLSRWLSWVKRDHTETFVGWNCFGFDLPFLVRRAWKLGVEPCLPPRANFRYLENWVDLREVWGFGDKWTEGGLDDVSLFLGAGTKNGDGKDFAKKWAEDRQAALLYLQNDIQLTYDVGLKMGVIV